MAVTKRLMASGSQLRRIKSPLCDFCTLSIQLVISHLRLVHSSDPNFHVMCGISGCRSAFSSFSALYQHIYKKYKDEGIIKSRSIIEPVNSPSSVSAEQLLDQECSLIEASGDSKEGAFN